MRLLLDTQVALWWLAGSARLSGKLRALIGRSPCAVSAASVWEVAIKHRLGKLPISPLAFRDELVAGGASVLAVTDAHAIETAFLPPHHRDPFDRLLIAQARIERLRAVSSDAAWAAYDLDLVVA